MQHNNEAAPPGAPDSVSKSVLRRALSASAIGNATEWFDYGIYAFGVAYISAAFFPGDLQEATLLALGTFAVSFLVRPLGGLFWGPLGDRLGRKTILAITIFMMTGATVAIGLIPSYESIGIAAPLLLVLMRMIQGFSTGGEYGGAATFMAEYAPDEKRGLFGSFLEFGTLGGFSLGALLMLGCSLLLGDTAMHEWGWRVPFILAAPLGLIGVYLRSRMQDTPVFCELETTKTPRKSMRGELRELLPYRKQLLSLAGLVVALNVVNYTLLSFMPTYFSTRIGLSANASLLVPVLGMLFMMLLVPFAGALSDKIGRKPLWWFSLVGIFLSAIPIYHLMSEGISGAVMGFMLLGFLYVPQLATISAMFPAMFPTHVRFAGFAIAYNVSTSLFGGTAPAANEFLLETTGNVLVPAYLMMGACVTGAISLLFVRETAGQSLRGTHIPGTPEAKRELQELDNAAGA